MTALLWLLAMVPPSALFLIAGIWVVRKKYGGVRHVLGVAAIVVGMVLWPRHLTSELSSTGKPKLYHLQLVLSQPNCWQDRDGEA